MCRSLRAQLSVPFLEGTGGAHVLHHVMIPRHVLFPHNLPGSAALNGANL